MIKSGGVRKKHARVIFYKDGYMKTTMIPLQRSALMLLLVAGSIQAATIFPGTAYLSSADSPFTGISFTYFHLENFEDGLLNTPGVTASAGQVQGPGPATDSVDGDDGIINGSGLNSRSYIFNFNSTVTSFILSAAVLGSLPTHVGLVWTDGLPSGNVSVEAFDNNSLSLGVISQLLADGSAFGGTSEDRFFGFTNAAGISRISITTPNTAELDHLQYGLASVGQVPEPGTVALVALGLMMAGVGVLTRRT